VATASPSIGALKELPPLPPSAEGADLEADGESDDGKDGKEGAGPRRKGRRRRGKKQKKGAAALAAAAGGEPTALGAPILLNGPGGADDSASDKELSKLTLSEAETRDDAAEDLVIATPKLGGPQIVGGLTVTETILGELFIIVHSALRLTNAVVSLGYGSHGTVVLRGEFQGRAVAVKRLLKDFVTIATHEVNLLQESDDHPHVIRYFCKEQRDTFLYIALELCPASLFDLIDQPSAFPTLTRDLDSKRALKQITSGIRHLHKLKIVHRDIKPQNILVATSNHGKGVRMLISDFGLCKKLDVDESSFQQTVNHAAGSFGYRAPEVLRGQVDPNETGSPGTPSNSTNGASALTSTSVSSSGTPTDPSMRLTRSIDIFSLGCIFYYVLTGGEHPFGGRYEREMNILQGKFSLERLDGLGEEAVEVQDLIARMVASDPRER
jgi:serine/threonine-protein kinase/endoribonuclease IRE1